MRISEMFPSRYATGEDLQGKAYTVTIARIEREAMRPQPGSPEVEKYVLYTLEGKRGIVLSKTLAGQIARALGSEDTDDWNGKKITIYPESVRVGGEQRTAIRARAAAPGSQL